MVRLGPRTGLAAGDVVKLAVDTAQVYLFDAVTGASLRSIPAGHDGDSDG